MRMKAGPPHAGAQDSVKINTHAETPLQCYTFTPVSVKTTCLWGTKINTRRVLKLLGGARGSQNDGGKKTKVKMLKFDLINVLNHGH